MLTVTAMFRIWTYQKIDQYVADVVDIDYSYRGSAEDRTMLDRAERARDRVGQATAARADARDDLELSREAYRTALDAGSSAGRLADDYARAQRRFARAETEVDAANRDFTAAERAAGEARRRIAAEIEDREDRRALFTFLLRFALVALSAVFGYWLLGRLRRSGSRYFPVAIAVVMYAAILAVVLAADYVTDYVDPLDFGPLVLALFGITATLLAFFALERYLARRVPLRRVQKGECLFCGYPVRSNRVCEGCGRDVVASCARCGEDRRVGTARCEACGAA
jgi:hypothetical protein